VPRLSTVWRFVVCYRREEVHAIHAVRGGFALDLARVNAISKLIDDAPNLCATSLPTALSTPT